MQYKSILVYIVNELMNCEKTKLFILAVLITVYSEIFRPFYFRFFIRFVSVQIQDEVIFPSFLVHNQNTIMCWRI